MPVPESETSKDETGPLLIKARLLVEVPEVVGANTMENVTLCPPVNEIGNVSPVGVNVAAVTVALLRVLVAFPWLVTVMVFVEFWPTVTVPKLSAVGLTASCDAPLPVVVFEAGGAPPPQSKLARQHMSVARIPSGSLYALTIILVHPAS